MTNNELYNTVLDCALKINEITGRELVNIKGILSISYNSRLKSCLGRARRNLIGTFMLEFNKSYFTFDGTLTEDKIAVIYHELVHTIDGCFNHGNKFNAICRQIERVTGINDIAGSRKKTGTNEYRKMEAKYKITCECCGTETFRHRTMISSYRGNAPQEGKLFNYRCKCGGDLYQTINR